MRARQGKLLSQSRKNLKYGQYWKIANVAISSRQEPAGRTVVVTFRANVIFLSSGLGAPDDVFFR